MSAAFVKTCGGAGDRLPATTLTILVPVAGCALANDVMVSAVGHALAVPLTVTDSKGNAYTRDLLSQRGDTNTALFRSHLAAALVLGDSWTVTFNAADNKVAIADEYTAIDPAGGPDKTQVANAFSATAATGTTAALTQADALAIAVFGKEATAAQWNVLDADYTLTQDKDTGGISTASKAVRGAFKVLSALAGEDAATTMSGGSYENASGIAVYRAVAGGGGGGAAASPPPLPRRKLIQALRSRPSSTMIRR